MRTTTCAIEAAGAKQRASSNVNAIFFTGIVPSMGFFLSMAGIMRLFRIADGMNSFLRG
jgi:hypothetical protein